MFHHIKLLLSFFIILTILALFSCNDEITSYNISEDELIGTWDLTKIIASYPSGKKEMTPQEKDLEITITLNKDKTYLQNQTTQGQVTSDSGTWDISNGVLTVISTSETFNFPCRLSGNILNLATTIKDPDSGIMLPITLEFTKQELVNSLMHYFTINKNQ